MRTLKRNPFTRYAVNRFNRLRVLLVTPDFPPYSAGGGAKIAALLASYLSRRGHYATVVSGYSGNQMKVTTVQGVKVVFLPYIRLKVLEKAIPQATIYMPPRPRYLASLLRILKLENYDIIHLFAFPGHLIVDFLGIYCILKNFKNVILTIHAFPRYVEREGPAPALIKLLYRIYLLTLGRLLVKHSKIITAVSKSTAIDAIKHGIPIQKIRIIPNGLDLDKHYYLYRKYLKHTKKEETPRRSITLLSIGRITWHKGFEYVILAIPKAQKLLKNVEIRYIIVGPIEDDNYYRKLLEVINTLKLNHSVTFTGYVDEDTKLKLLLETDIFVAPSLHEGFGLALLEAMALGKPIIVTNISGHRDLVKNGVEAILVNAKDPNSIAEAIVTLLRDLETAKKLSRNAFCASKKYHINNVGYKYEGLYYEIAYRM